MRQLTLLSLTALMLACGGTTDSDVPRSSGGNPGTGGTGGAAGSAGAAGVGGGAEPPAVDWGLLPIGADISYRFTGNGFEDVSLRLSEWTFMQANYHENETLLTWQSGGMVTQLYVKPALEVGTTEIPFDHNNLAEIVVSGCPDGAPLPACTFFGPDTFVRGTITIDAIDLSYGGSVSGSFQAVLDGENGQSQLEISAVFYSDTPTRNYQNGRPL